MNKTLNELINLKIELNEMILSELKSNQILKEEKMDYDKINEEIKQELKKYKHPTAEDVEKIRKKILRKYFLKSGINPLLIGAGTAAATVGALQIYKNGLRKKENTNINNNNEKS